MPCETRSKRCPKRRSARMSVAASLSSSSFEAIGMPFTDYNLSLRLFSRSFRHNHRHIVDRCYVYKAMDVYKRARELDRHA